MVEKPSEQKSTGSGKASGSAVDRVELARNLFAQLKATAPQSTPSGGAPSSGTSAGGTAATGGTAALAAALGVLPATVGNIRVVGPAAQANAAAATKSRAATGAGAAQTSPVKNLPKKALAVRPPQYRLRFRLLPVTIFLLVLMLGARIGDTWRVFSRDGRLPEVPTLQAETAQTPASPPASKERKDEHAKPTKNAEPAPLPPPIAKPETVDVELVKHLSARREELDSRAKSLDQREALVAITEKRLDQKLAELQNVRQEIQNLLRQMDDKQKAQIESLVRIYESMKPKDAARIFEQLEPDVLLSVVERMKENKTAPILAAMDPMKAKDLTTRLAEQRRLPTVP
ncbi:MAG: hypothetical protein WCF85_22335 [Rhodospirillaceae bacterium]